VPAGSKLPDLDEAAHGRRFKSCPRYGLISDQALKVAGFCEGARNERLHVYLSRVLIDCDREPERVEDTAT
jgi:hypothetical protein